MSSLQNELTRLINVVEGLSDTERAKVDAQVARITAMESDLRANMPITSNFWDDTRKFTGLCDGQLETPMTFEEGAFGGAWGLTKYGSTANITVEVVPAIPSKLKARGLHWETDSPILALAGAEHNATDTYFGSNFNIAIFDIEATGSTWTDHPNMSRFYFSHGAGQFTGWSKHPGCRVQASCFYNVMEYVGAGEPINALPAGFGFGANRYPRTIVGKAELGQGWVHRKQSANILGGSNDSHFSIPVGERIKVAVALPYVGLGDHGDKPVWADFNGEWTHHNQNHYIDGRIAAAG